MLLVSLCFVLCSCIIIPLSKYYEFEAQDVESVQFYLLGDDNYSESGFHKQIEPVYTLSEEQTEDFLSDFSKIKFSDVILIVLAAVDPSFCYGDIVIRINFINGDYSFYSCAGYGQTYNKNDKLVDSTHFSCDREDLENLLIKYYPDYNKT